MRPENKAEELFTSHYHEIMERGEGDICEECIVSLLAIQHSKVTVNEVMKHIVSAEDYDFWGAVNQVLSEM